MSTQSHPRELSVLVADDSRAIRVLLIAILKEQGIQNVYEAVDGESAIQLLENTEPPIDLLFCDLFMPGIDGVETMRRVGLCRTRPAIALISGFDAKLLYTVSDLASEYGLRVLGTVTKPFNEDDIRNVLDALQHTQRESSAHRNQSITIEELDEAIRLEQIEIRYQPQVQISDGSPKGVEALVRLRHPVLGLLSPDMFIPLAEKAGRISAITMLALKNALQQAGEWHAQKLDLSMSVNISVSAMQRFDFPDVIALMAAQAGVPPNRLVLEITESEVESGLEILHIISRFRLQGFRLSLDDYGTGQSGLQRLKRLPFTEMKLDKGFVSDAWNNPDTRTILQSSIELGHKLRMEVIAEGVETWQDWKLLKTLGCDLAQGYLISKPIAGKEIPAWASKWHVKDV